MAITKCVAALAAGSLVCFAVLGLRTQAAAPEKSQGATPVTKASAQLIATSKKHGQGGGGIHQDRAWDARLTGKSRG